MKITTFKPIRSHSPSHVNIVTQKHCCEISLRWKTTKKTYEAPHPAQNPALFKDGNCPYHDKMLIYFCNTCFEPVCGSCSTGYHKSHKLDDMDTAFHKIKTQLLNSSSSLDFKRSKVNQNFESLLDLSEKMANEAESARRKLNSDFDHLISLLQSKKEQFNKKIDEMEAAKKSEIDSALDSASKTINSIEEANQFILQSQTPRYSENPIEFFQLINSKGKGYLNNLTNKSVPYVPSSLYFPSLSSSQK